MMPFNEIRSEIQGKITGPRIIGHKDLQIYPLKSTQGFSKI